MICISLVQRRIAFIHRKKKEKSLLFFSILYCPLLSLQIVDVFGICSTNKSSHNKKTFFLEFFITRNKRQ